MKQIKTPHAATPFHGRAAELEALRTRFQQGSRLTVVTGPPGAGKSRMIQEFSHRHVDEICAVVNLTTFVDLADAQSLAEFVARVARSLDMSTECHDAPADTIEQMALTLEQSGAVLLVIDHPEGAIDALRGLASRWLARLPNLCLLVASRERLGLAAENVVELGPLGLSGPEGSPVGSEAFNLFVERARAVDPAFAPASKLSLEQTHIIAELVTELQGLPLAIVLAASRTAVTDTGEILRRIKDDAFVVLRPGKAQDQMPALKTSVLASWCSLEPWEKDALRQCTVFRGGFDVALAEDVLDLSPYADAPPVIDVLQALRSKSMIAPPANGRLALYRVIADFAATNFAASEPPTQIEDREQRSRLERRHVSAVARRAGAFAREEWFWKTREPRRWFHANLGNIEVALSRIQTDLSDAEEPSGTLRELTWMLGHGLIVASPWLPEALKRAEALLKLGDEQPGDAYFRFARQVARARVKTGHHDAGVALYSELTALASEHGEQGWAVVFEVHELLAEGAQLGPHPSHLDRARELVEYASPGNDEFTQAFAYYGHGRMLRLFGRTREARDAEREAARLAKSCGATALSIEIWLALGHLALEAGEPLEASRYFRTMMRVAEESDYSLARTLAAAGLAIADRDVGEFEGAEQPFQDYLMPMLEKGYSCDWTVALEYALALLDLRKWSQAGELIQTIERATKRNHSPLTPLAIAVHCALLEASVGQLTEARLRLEAFESPDRRSLWGRRLSTVRRFLAFLGGEPGEQSVVSSNSFDRGLQQPEDVERYRRQLDEAGDYVERETVSLLAVALRLSGYDPNGSARESSELEQVQEILNGIFRTGTPGADTSTAWVQRSAWIRVLTRLLESRLPLETSFAVFATAIDPYEHALIVHPSGSLFRVPGSKEIVDLGSQKLVADLLSTLIAQRLTDRHAPLPTATIFERVWPAEKFSLAAPQRIYNKISALKKKGLREVLVSSADGYLIDDQLEVFVFEPELGLVDSFMKLARLAEARMTY